MAAIIKINGHEYPAPKRGLDPMVATIVDAGRNANGVTVGQKIGRDQQKLNNLVWPHLKAEQWAALLQEFENFYVTVTYCNPVTNDWTTRKMYPGDRHGEPYFIDPVTKKPTDYINCKVNLIDCGE